MKERRRELKYSMVHFKTAIDDHRKMPVLLLYFALRKRDIPGGDTYEYQKNMLALCDFKKYKSIINENDRTRLTIDIDIPYIDTPHQMIFNKIPTRMKINDSRMLWKHLLNTGWTHVTEEL